jgi:hypothetical protein
MPSGWCGSKVWVARGEKRQRTGALHDLAEQPSPEERFASWSAGHDALTGDAG